MEIKDLPEKYVVIWKKIEPLFKLGRPGDDEHAMETVKFILNYKGNMKLDKDILIPVAMMHDIGHIAILPEHFKYITGPEKIMNGKLVHMLTGAKIAKDILDSVNYNKEKTAEIVDIISVHDADQLNDIDIKKFYNTENKKIFHDIDSLDRFTKIRLKSMLKMYKDKKELFKLLRDSLKNIFTQEFREFGEKRLNALEKENL